MGLRYNADIGRHSNAVMVSLTRYVLPLLSYYCHTLRLITEVFDLISSDGLMSADFNYFRDSRARSKPLRPTLDQLIFSLSNI